MRNPGSNSSQSHAVGIEQQEGEGCKRRTGDDNINISRSINNTSIVRKQYPCVRTSKPVRTFIDEWGWDWTAAQESMEAGANPCRGMLELVDHRPRPHVQRYRVQSIVGSLLAYKAPSR